MKAYDAKPFVHLMTKCDVTRKFADGIERNIIFRGMELTERLIFHPKTKVEFLRTKGIEMGTIINEIVEDETGALHLRFAFSLELVGLKVGDATFRAGYVDIRVMGKGRKQRILTLWKSVAASLRAWLSIRGDVSVPELFVNARAQPLTRSGFKHLLKKHVPAAAHKCPSLKTKRVSPHVCRHTCALNTLQATGDIRKVALWLGHESIQSTEAYLRADPSQKRAMLEAVLPPTLKRGSFRPADKLIASFRGK